MGLDLEGIRALSDPEIAQELENQHEEWRNLRFQNALGRLTSFHRLREVRKDIARLKTVQQERAIALDPVAYYGGNDRLRARRRAEKQRERLAARRQARREASGAGRRRRFR
jgi:large subunit ribosomal protein L29